MKAQTRSSIASQLIAAARRLRAELNHLQFAAPVTHVYNPLDYGHVPHEAYLRRYADSPRHVVFLGMNPGPFGMAQTGVPFGEVAAVRDWLKIEGQVRKPSREHPRRPVEGFGCRRSEVSGRRLWGLFAARFASPEEFFAEHLVLNYCPLCFFERSGRNRTPDKLRPAEKDALFPACDRHLQQAVRILQPRWLIGVGDFAAKRAARALEGIPVRIGRILHPSPASPRANRNWATQATRQLQELGVWDQAEQRA